MIELWVTKIDKTVNHIKLAFSKLDFKGLLPVARALPRPLEHLNQDLQAVFLVYQSTFFEPITNIHYRRASSSLHLSCILHKDT